MATGVQAKELLTQHGTLRPQPPTDWTGPFVLPVSAERFYREVGPVDVFVESFGNGFILPSLARLWPFQAGYRWNGLTGEPIADWQDDWLVVADQGGDPFILSRGSGIVLHDEHGRGIWQPREMFPDLDTMAACLARLGAVVAAAGEGFTDEDCNILSEWLDKAVATLQELLGPSRLAVTVLRAVGWA